MKYCSKCGTELNDDALFCSECGAASETKSQKIAFTYDEPEISKEISSPKSVISNDNSGAYTHVSNNGKNSKKKSRRKGLFLGLAAALAIAVCGGAVILASSDTLKNKLKLASASPEEYLSDTYTLSIEKYKENLASAYEYMPYYFDSGRTIANKLNITVKPESMFSRFLTYGDLSLTNASLNFLASSSDNEFKIDAEAFINDLSIISGTVAGDLSTMSFYAQIPELSSSYLYLPLSDTDIGSISSNILTNYSELYSALLNEEFRNSVIDRYSSLVIDLISNEAVLTKNISIEAGEITESVNKFSVTITAGEYYDFLVKVLDTMYEDDEILNIIDLYINYINSTAIYLDYNAKGLIASMRSELLDETLSDDERNTDFFTINTWVNNTGNICGMELTYNYTDDYTAELGYINPASDGDEGFYAWFNENSSPIAEFECSAAKSDSALSGEGVLKIYSNDNIYTVNIDYSDVVNDIKNHHSSGSYTFSCKELLGAGTNIKISYEASDKHCTITISGAVTGISVGTVTFDYSMLDASAVNTPLLSEEIKNSAYDITDHDASNTYFSEIYMALPDYADSISEKLGTDVSQLLYEILGY